MIVRMTYRCSLSTSLTSYVSYRGSQSLGSRCSSHVSIYPISLSSLSADPAVYSNVKNQVKSYGIKVAISEMQYGYTVQGNSQAVLDVIDVVHARAFHMSRISPNNHNPLT